MKPMIMEIKAIILNARSRAFAAVNIEMLNAYFEIGRKIVEEEQKGQIRAGYGKKVIGLLSNELKKDFGNGFDGSNLRRMRRFYLAYKIWETVSPKLTWSHYCELIKISNCKKRKYFEVYAAHENLSVRDLKRQIYSKHYERLIAGSKQAFTSDGSNKLALTNAEEIIKDPYVLEFLDLDETKGYTEQEMENRIMDRMQKFLLELGQGFTFVARQKKLNIENSRFFIDLLFYNIYLNCYVLIEIKTSKFRNEDAGQINFYLNYVKKEMNHSGDDEPIGIILCAEKNKIQAEYALSGLSNRMFISKYMLYLPSKDKIEEEIRKAV